MKRIKLMLLSLALVAVVGGALAFKARYTVSYCTTVAVQNAAGVSTCIDPANNLALTCTTTIHGKLAFANGTRTVCTTDAIFSVAQDTYTCPANRACNPTTYRIPND